MMRRPLLVGLGLLVATAIVLLVAQLLAPGAALPRGWLLAFSIWSAIPLGSMTLLLTHRLTGGAWGDAMAPVLRPAAALMPLVALAFLPVVLTLPSIYPWAADPGAAPADVARLYLNGPSFAARAAIALLGWSFFGIVAGAGAGGRLFAALGLAFHGFFISLVAVDWFLSIEPRYTASAFAAMIAIQQILAALAFAGAIGAPDLRGKVAGDVGGLMIASLLGVVYLELMSFIIAWYGDLPEKAAWYLKRGGPGWTAALVAALAIGALVPFCLLLVRGIRRHSTGLRAAGALVLVGTVLHMTWLIAPAYAEGQILLLAIGLVALGAMAAISLLLGSTLRPRVQSSDNAREAAYAR
jgi:hypothetical protein